MGEVTEPLGSLRSTSVFTTSEPVFEALSVMTARRAWLPSPWTSHEAVYGAVVSGAPSESQEPLEQLYQRVKKQLNRLGMDHRHLVPRTAYMKNDIPVAGCAHQAGTVRFGRDPARSVLDVNCKAHELDNLYVLDSSFFVSIGAVNPTLTIIANALRVGEHLLERMR